MENKEKKKYISGFTICGHIMTACSSILWVVVLLMVPFSFTILISILSDIFVICTIYGLGDAKTRINVLEDLLVEKKVLTIQEINTIDVSDGVENRIRICKKCGYQIFPEEEKCSNCGEPVNKPINNPKIQICKNCRRPIFPEESVCKYCGKQKNEDDN